MTDMTDVTGVVDALLPVIERAIARLRSEVEESIEQLREEMRATVEVLDGNDHALVGEIQRLRGSGGEQVAEVLASAGAAWERFVKGEAEKLGLKVIAPKVAKEEDG